VVIYPTFWVRRSSPSDTPYYAVYSTHGLVYTVANTYGFPISVVTLLLVMKNIYI
jgi:hypothetical protein